MQGLLLFTLSRSDQSDECRSHSPFSAGAHPVNYVSMICPLDLRTWKNTWSREENFFEGKIIDFFLFSIRENKVLTVRLSSILLNLNSNDNTQFINRV